MSSSATPLRIRQDAWDALRRHAEAAYPEECCGVLVGLAGPGGRHAREALPCANQADRRRARYSIDERDILRIVKSSRARGEEILGFYHSHPDGPAQASAADLADAWWPGCSYLVTGVAASITFGKVGETRSFLLVNADDGAGGKRFEPELVEVMP
jgi:proteasome lid subunit RPN8/RPN11